MLSVPNTVMIHVTRPLECVNDGLFTETTHRVKLRSENFVDANKRPAQPSASFPKLKLDLTRGYVAVPDFSA